MDSNRLPEPINPPLRHTDTDRRVGSAPTPDVVPVGMTHHTHEDTRSAAAQLAEAKARRSESWRDPVWKELDGLRDALADEVEDDRRENDEQARAEARWARRGYDQ